MLFSDGNVRHCGSRGRAMPVFFTRCNPDDVTGFDFLNRAAVQLYPAQTRSHEQSLSKWVRMPSSTRAWLERNGCTAYSRRRIASKRGIDPDRSRKIFRRADCAWLRPALRDVHVVAPIVVLITIYQYSVVGLRAKIGMNLLGKLLNGAF